MGPRSFDRGNVQFQFVRQFLRIASMGPRSFDRGNLVEIEELQPSLKWLQWGRARSTAET